MNGGTKLLLGAGGLLLVLILVLAFSVAGGGKKQGASARPLNQEQRSHNLEIARQLSRESVQRAETRVRQFILTRMKKAPAFCEELTSWEGLSGMAISSLPGQQEQMNPQEYTEKLFGRHLFTMEELEAEVMAARTQNLKELQAIETELGRLWGVDFGQMQTTLPPVGEGATPASVQLSAAVGRMQAGAIQPGVVDKIQDGADVMEQYDLTEPTAWTLSAIVSAVFKIPPQYVYTIIRPLIRGLLQFAIDSIRGMEDPREGLKKLVKEEMEKLADSSAATLRDELSPITECRVGLWQQYEFPSAAAPTLPMDLRPATSTQPIDEPVGGGE